MKIIEKKMNDAIKNGYDFKQTNTRVNHGINGYVVWLFETPIYIKYFDDVYVCDGGWNTVTTQSRLNALGVDYHRNPRRNEIEMTPLVKMMRLVHSL